MSRLPISCPYCLQMQARIAELEVEVIRLRQQIEGHCDRIAKQSELLIRHAEDAVRAREACNHAVAPGVS